MVIGSDIIQYWAKEVAVQGITNEDNCRKLCTDRALAKCSQCVGYRYNKTCTIIQRATKTQQHLTPIGEFNMLDYFIIGK